MDFNDQICLSPVNIQSEALWGGFVIQVTELECVSGQTTTIKSQKTELNQTIEELESALKAKEEVRVRHPPALKTSDIVTNIFSLPSRRS